MNNAITRRQWLRGIAAATTLAPLPAAFRAAMGPDEKFDLGVKGGEVLDPSQKWRGVRDVGLRNGLVEAVEANIPAERALRTINATGRLVVPGLIDLHAHTYPYGSAVGIPADPLGPLPGTTPSGSARRA